jgi:hypothetical protein
MDIQRSIEMQNLQPADVALQGLSAKGCSSMLAALIAWERKRGLSFDRRSVNNAGFNEGVAGKKKKAAIAAAIARQPRVRLYVPRLKKELTVDQKLKLREFNRIRTARYREANREDVKIKNREHARKHTASMTPEQKAARLANERRWRAERKNRKQQAV